MLREVEDENDDEDVFCSRSERWKNYSRVLLITLIRIRKIALPFYLLLFMNTPLHNNIECCYVDDWETKPREMGVGGEWMEQND